MMLECGLVVSLCLQYPQEEIAEEFGIPVQFQRFWNWAKRQNHTYRPIKPLTPEEESKPVFTFSLLRQD